MRKFPWTKWLAAVGLFPLAYFLWGVAVERGNGPALGVALVVASLFLSLGIGRLAGWLVCKFLIAATEEFEARLKASLSAFGLFSLPWLVAVWTNKHLDTDITLLSLEMHIFWSCAVAIFAFVASPEEKIK